MVVRGGFSWSSAGGNFWTFGVPGECGRGTQRPLVLGVRPSQSSWVSCSFCLWPQFPPLLTKAFPAQAQAHGPTEAEKKLTQVVSLQQAAPGGPLLMP